MRITTFSIYDIPEFSKKERIVVVGIIGKSPYGYPNKTTPLLPGVQTDENGIECIWDERRGILYLHAVTYLDTRRLTSLALRLDNNSKRLEKDADAEHWLVAASELAADSCKLIALVFQLSHIVVLSSPSPTFDLSYVQMFKAIDAYRAEILPSVTEALADIQATGTWESHTRTCCPRLLFHFRRAPVPLKRKPQGLKRLEHATEDQLYSILRKARIITNVCAKSLFAIPKNEEFVYISTDDETGYARDVSTLVRGLVGQCTGERAAAGAAAAPAAGPSSQGEAARGSFRSFLQRHVDRALGDGFDDNVGKYAMTTSFFELPSAESWIAAARALTPVYVGSEGAALHQALATDVRFSEARCAKMLPLAKASYAEGLPLHYSSRHYAHQERMAMCQFESEVRGPMAASAVAQLRASCAANYRERALCEAPSLTGHGCIHPKHDESVEHSSGVRYVSACDCGRSRASREDPYSVEAANCTFYAEAAERCDGCRALDTHHFPVFEPSTPIFRAASVEIVFDQKTSESGRESPATPESAGLGVYEPLYPGVAVTWKSMDEDDLEEYNNVVDDDDDNDDDEDDEEEEEDDEEKDVDGDGYIAHFAGDSVVVERVIARQPSTTEYLPCMLHRSSPAGLLPRAAHWALRCLGASSLYSHALGLPEHLQPGFLPHTNYLVPWDAPARVEQAPPARAAQPRGRGKAAPAHFTVKIFIGFEYECPRGHRFMMSSPTAVTAGGGSAAAGARLAASDMPLLAGCVCRAAPPPLAALTRVHVVTPKAPVHVTLDPRVQAVGSGSIFVPMPASAPPVQLTASAYWVLRLPFVYADERGAVPRPQALPPPGAAGRLLAPLFGLQEQE